jgi:hypothetical protein
MSTKPDVRPATDNHPDPEKRAKKRHPPMEIRELLSDAAMTLFNERGGKRLLKALDSIEGTLDMYDQDVARGKHNEEPESFRWRVTPGVAIRLRKELDGLLVRLNDLMKQCEADGVKRVEEMYPRSEFIYPDDDLQTYKNAEQEKEAAPTAPIPTAA